MPQSRGPALLPRSYPLPFIALGGLIVGSSLTWVLGSPDRGSDAWLLTLVVGGSPIAYKTIRGLLRGVLAADIVATLAIIAAVAFDEGFAGTVIVLMQSGGEALEDYGLGRASSALSALVARAPRSATRKEGDETRVIKAEEVRPGDTLIVKKGELIPVDGEILSPAAEVDESALTGEPLPRPKLEGDGVMSGSINVGGAIEMEATSVSGESQYAKIVRLVTQAQGERPRIQRLADRYAVWFTPLVLLVALAGAALTADLRTILSVLVVATPCPLILATPIAVISGVNRAASHGIIVKSGAALEQISSTRVVVFDKTGTLTYGLPSVERVVPLGGNDRATVLRRAASLEQLSSHPLAVSVAALAREESGPLTMPSNFKETPSRGVEGDVDGTHVLVGLKKFCEERMLAPFAASSGSLLDGSPLQGKLVTFVAIEGKPAGVIVFTDQVRPGVPYMVGRLRELGIQDVVMLTGDNRSNAEVVAMQSGITSFEADLLPSQKVDQIGRLKRDYGTTVMVGDGINDAPALAAASVGIAMGARGAGISAESADIVLLVDDVTRVPETVETGRRMVKIARQGINFGLGASIVLMGIAAVGFVEPASGAILQELIDVSVILNALRVR